jgi:RNA polymerase sigma-70 factor, ECF subfamily
VLLDPRGLRVLDELAVLAVAGPGGVPFRAATSGAWAPRPRRPADGEAEDAERDRGRALLELAQRGDGEAFGALYQMHADLVFRYIHQRVGSQSLAEDLTQETFLRAYRRLDSFTWQGKDVAAWFVTIARNLVLDHVKSARYRLEVTTAELLQLDSGTAEDDGPASVVLERMRHRRLVEAVRALRPDQQECMVLRFFQNLSLAQTAEVMGRSEGAVKQLQLRAVRALARSLAQEEL